MPPHPVLGRTLHDVRVGGGQRQREHGARVGGVDDAVVPHAAGRVQRRRLALDLRLEHLLAGVQLLLVDGHPRPAAALRATMSITPAS